VPAGKTGRCYVVEEKEDLGKRELANIDDDNVRLIVSQKVTSAAVKEALAQAKALKGKLSAAQQEIATKQQRLKEIGEDQSRLRANLEKVPPTSDAYKRYLKKFDTQETEIEQLQEAVKKLQDQESKQQKEYESFLAELNVE
jgi:septal ring factor EnvC (AmiA/AmiB activator)